MSTKKRFFSFFIMLLAFSMLLVGCSSSEETSNEDDNSDQSESEKDTLVFGRGGDSTSLDPIAVTEGETFRVTCNIYETLLKYGEQDMTINPGLAKDWSVSEDKLTYTFELQEGVKFHDGTDFNAEAVVFNFERWMNGDADQFPYYSMFGGYKGEESHVIESVTAVEDYKVEFKLKRPQTPFLQNLAMSPFGIASPSAIEEYGDKFRENPVGTGPFKFSEWRPNERIVLEKNQDYWQEGLPKLNKVIYTVIADNSARLNALISGEIDLLDGLDPQDATQLTDDLQLFERPSNNVGYLGLTATREPLDNKLVRQALNHAVNKQELIDAFYGGKGDPAVNPMPPVLEGYNDETEDYEYDVDKAKALLEEAGYPDGFEMDLWAMPVARPYMPNAAKIAEALQQSFKDIGVTANIQTKEWAPYLDDARDGKFDAFLLGWTGDNGDPDNFLYTLLDKDNIGSNNYSYYSNDEVHDLLIEAQAETDQEKRIELYKKAQVIIKEDAPWIPLVHSKPLLAGSKDIKNFKPHPKGSDILTNVEFE
ncbi:ABC transporter substrate-binding protein [Bacillus carboniphilus]|uniref:ABC transporter substrate-binding protein n=1 Tax=Bacillus carboniphilus TaxID=86663 RepID=A0ABY9JW09_9BACI|nr:ABC transporter substrate-binding protein [Bacillus carboniphilus]WLR42688.1 ABC transporter substrate-binding protein [Bacillus carboniphilus]